MRILLDECVDPGIRDFLTGHEVRTVGEANWFGTADRELVQLAQGRFDVLLTLDRGFEFQHNLSKLTFGIVIVQPPRNCREDYEPLASAPGNRNRATGQAAPRLRAIARPALLLSARPANKLR